tara:strand:+ start:499 stop:1836 length:1338 start_codon:yes stop_codon:yes gene_type:complete
MAISKIKSDSIDSIAAAKIPNLDAAKITTGSIANARVPASAVTQHVTATDTSKIENDIAILALHQAVNENKSAYSLANSWIEQFEDSTYITALTTCARIASGEYVGSYYSISGAFVSDANTALLIHSDTTNGSTTFTDSSSHGLTITLNGSMTHSTAQAKIGGSSLAFNGSSGLQIANVMAFGNGTGYTFEYWIHYASGNTSSTRVMGNNPGGNANQFFVRPKTTFSEGHYGMQWGTGHTQTSGTTSPETSATGSWNHMAIVQEGDYLRSFANGVNISSRARLGSYGSTLSNWHIGSSGGSGEFLGAGGYLDEIRFSNTARYSGTTTFTPQVDNIAANAAGNFTSTAITPQDGSAKTSVGLVLLYKNHAGTNALNTDIICRVSANNGTNYTACVLAAKGTFSTGILIAVAPAVTVTSGTQLKYKVEFANQSASKQARIHGVAMTY